jgi:hypothetical protein
VFIQEGREGRGLSRRVLWSCGSTCSGDILAIFSCAIRIISGENIPSMLVCWSRPCPATSTIVEPQSILSQRKYRGVAQLSNVE